jgi:hypothetical protein
MFILVVFYIVLLIVLCIRKRNISSNFKTITQPDIIKQPPNNISDFLSENNNFDLNEHLNEDMINILDNRKSIYPIHDAFIMNF